MKEKMRFLRNIIVGVVVAVALVVAWAVILLREFKNKSKEMICDPVHDATARTGNKDIDR